MRDQRITTVRILCTLIVIGMLAVTSWASLEKGVLQGYIDVLSQRWSAATLADAYAGFLTFFFWVWYKETTAVARITWFALIMAFGNIAMSAYVILTIARAGKNATVKTVLLNAQDNA
jgi:hypothetical protein